MAKNGDQHLLLIEPLTKSLARKDFLIFKTGDVLQGEEYELKLRVTNKSATHFPGGKLTGIKLTQSHTNNEDLSDKIEDKMVESLAPGEFTDIDLGVWYPYFLGVIKINCSVTSKDGVSIGFYQKLPGSSRLQHKDQWEDFIPVFSRAEVNQRYTNYLLVILTSVVIIATALTYFIK